MKAVHLLVNSALPDDLKNYNQNYDVKSINKILNAVAKKHPERYTEVTKRIADIGRSASWRQGESITLADFQPVIDKKAIYAEMHAEIAALPKDENFKAARRDIFQKYNTRIEKETSEAALKNRNNIANAVLSGARGKSPQLKAMISTPGTYSDYKGEPIDMFIEESFAEGIRPAAFLASTFGARSSVISTKVSTAKGGDWAKQAASVAADMVVRTDDCKATTGMPASIDDSDIKGRVLSADIAGVPAGTFIDRNVIDHLRKQGAEKLLVRSPITCGVHNGLCAKCVGKFYNGGKLPKIGDSIGLLASSTLGEPVTQMALCLAENTEVRMADFSSKKIQDIVPGDFVLGADTNANTFPVKVLDTFSQGIKTVQDYVFAKGQTKYKAVITATKDHKVLLNKRTSSAYNMHKYGTSWGPAPYTIAVLPLGELNKNTHAVYSSSYTGTEDIAVPAILAYMAGVFLGDGIRLAPAGDVRISCADLQLIENVNAEACGVGMKLCKRKRGHDWAFTRNVTTGKNPFKQLLRRINLDDKYCHQKTIADELWQWDNMSLLNFIAGYFDADGSIYAGRSGGKAVTFLSTSKPLIETLKAILELRFAIHTTSVYSEPKLRKGSNYIRHSVAITRADMVAAFANKVGPYSRGVKKAKLFAPCVQFKQDRNPSGNTFGKFITAANTREVPCFDIEVEHPDHLFVLANGLIVSNSAKHTAGMSTGKKSFAGLEYIQQFVQSPETFKDRAPLAHTDGVVESVADAPQGGKYITVGAEKYYVPTGTEVMVKPGDKLEAGDQLADGLIDPEEVVTYKGLGEGRLYYANRLTQILSDSGAGNDKRSAEVLARAALRHVKVTAPDGLGPYLPDDLADYNAVQASYTPPETAKEYDVKSSIGKYLQKPVMHYSIGTRITPKVANTMQEYSVKSVLADDTKPEFEPVMVRLRTASHSNPDWLASLGTSYLTKQLNESAVKGDVTNIESNPDFRPRLAVGVDFGKNVAETGNF